MTLKFNQYFINQEIALCFLFTALIAFLALYIFSSAHMLKYPKYIKLVRNLTSVFIYVDSIFTLLISNKLPLTTISLRILKNHIFKFTIVKLFIYKFLYCKRRFYNCLKQHRPRLKMLN